MNKFYHFLKTYWLPILWMGVIFSLSSISNFDAEKSLPFADKVAHFWEYGILGFIWARAWWRDNLKVSHFWIYALILGALYGISDEIHQLFVPHRDFDLRDWAMDIISTFAGVWFYIKYYLDTRPRFLLHVCCANCGALAIEKLKKKYRLDVIFYNPNIEPNKEFQKRLTDVIHLCRHESIKLFVPSGQNSSSAQLLSSKTLKSHAAISKSPKPSFWANCSPKVLATPEGGARCTFCFTRRLEETVRTAKSGNYHFFGTSLTVGPRKEAAVINKIGKQLAKKYGIIFYETDFKQNGGFARSVVLSREAGFYRQKYCGCHFSCKN